MLWSKQSDRKFTQKLMYSFTQRGMAFSISFLQCCGLFLTAVLSPGQFQTFWSPTAPCTSFSRCAGANYKTWSPQKTTDPWQCGLERKNVLPLPCKHCILHLQSVVMQQLTLRKGSKLQQRGNIQMQDSTSPIITRLPPNKPNGFISLQNTNLDCTSEKKR